MRTAAVLLLSCLCAFGQLNVTYTWTDFQLAPQAVKRATLTPLAPFADYNGAILTASPMPKVTSGAGSATWTNVAPGYSYRIQLDTPYGSTVRTSGFPSTLSGNVNGRDWLGDIRGQSFYYLYPSITNVTLGFGTALTNNNAAAVTLTNAANRFVGAFTGNGAAITNLHQAQIVDGYVLIPTNHVQITVQNGTDYFVGISSNDWFTATNSAPVSALGIPNAAIPSATTNTFAGQSVYAIWGAPFSAGLPLRFYDSAWEDNFAPSPDVLVLYDSSSAIGPGVGGAYVNAEVTVTTPSVTLTSSDAAAPQVSIVTTNNPGGAVSLKGFIKVNGNSLGTLWIPVYR